MQPLSYHSEFDTFAYDPHTDAMRRIFGGILAAAALLIHSARAGFLSPSFTVAYGPGRFQSNQVYTVGEMQEIRFDVSDFSEYENYSLQIWQQAVHVGDANDGPILSSTSASLRSGN